MMTRTRKWMSVVGLLAFVGTTAGAGVTLAVDGYGVGDGTGPIGVEPLDGTGEQHHGPPGDVTVVPDTSTVEDERDALRADAQVRADEQVRAEEQLRTQQQVRTEEQLRTQQQVRNEQQVHTEQQLRTDEQVRNEEQLRTEEQLRAEEHVSDRAGR